MVNKYIEMPKISVIIPIYNVEKYLSKCIESIVNQTLKDIEILCINDCSTDGSLQIIKEYAKKDERVRLFDLSQNQGAANARNIGIENANGEYISFIDGDDFIDLNFYEKLFESASIHNADIVKGCYRYASVNTIDYEVNKKIKEDKNNFSYGFCSAIFKYKLIKENNIKFPLLCDMEDPVFTYNAAIRANSIIVEDEIHVNISVRNDSQTAGIPKFHRIKDKITGLEAILNLANNSEVSENSYAYTISFWLNMIIVNSVLNKDAECREFIADKIFLLFDKIKYKDKVLKLLSKSNEFLFKVIAERNKDKILHYEQAQKIYYIRKKIKNG